MFILQRPVLALFLASLAVGCGSSDSGSKSGPEVSNVSTTSSSQEVTDWRSVHYSWISNWTPCRDNKVRINRQKQITSSNCGAKRTAVLSAEDFLVLQTLIKPVTVSFKKSLKCTNETIMDWAIYTYVTVRSKTNLMYSFDAEQNCARGDRPSVEKLQENLEALDSKYFPR